MRRASLAALTLAGARRAAAAAAQQRRPFPPLPVPAAALEAAPLSFTLSQSLEADTNYDLVNDPAGTTYYGETRFALDYLRDAATQPAQPRARHRPARRRAAGRRFEFSPPRRAAPSSTTAPEGVDTLFDAG